MFENIKDRKVLITGSSTGIGFALAEKVASYGGSLVMHGLNNDMDSKVKELESKYGAKVLYIAADLTKEEGCKKLVEEGAKFLGGLDVLINFAGGLGGRSSVEEITPEFYNHVMNINVFSNLFTLKYALPYLKKSEHASVVFTSSNAASQGGGPGASVYGASKAWLEAAQKTWVKEYSKDGIRFNSVAPGYVETSFHDDKSDELKKQIWSSIPLGRPSYPEDLSATYLFLALDEMSGYITGCTLHNNGGMYCNV